MTTHQVCDTIHLDTIYFLLCPALCLMPKCLAAFCMKICIFYEYCCRTVPTVTTPISSLCYPCTVSGYTVRTLRNTRCNPVLPVAVGCYSTATSVEYLHHTWPSIYPTGPRRSSPALLRQVVKL